MGKKKPEELYDGLDPYQLDQLKADLEKWKQKMPAPAPTAPPVSTFGDNMGAVGDTLKKGFWRGMENLSRFGEGAAWLPIQALKLPGSINQAVGGAPGLTDRVKQGATNIENELRHGTQFFQEKAGVPKEEPWYPTSDRIIPAWMPEMAGQFTQPGPMLSPIKKLLSKEAIKPALKGMAQMGTYGAGLSAVEQFNKPEQEQDWSAVPKSAAMMAAGSPIFQRLAGAFERVPGKPAQAGLPGAADRVEIPEFKPNVSAPPPPRTPPPAQPQPMSSGRQLPDYVDAQWKPIESTGDLPHFPTKAIEDLRPPNPTIYAPGPVATGPGTSIAMPGPVTSKPHMVEDLLVKGGNRPSLTNWDDLIPKELAVNEQPRDPFLLKNQTPKLEPPPKTLTEPGIQHQLGYDPNPYAPTSSGKPELSSAAPVSPVPDIPTGREAAREVSQEVAHDTDAFQKLSDIINNERGSTHLGGGVGPIERVLTQRRFAEKHPQDFGPVYRSALDRFEWAAAQKHDLTQLGRSYFLLEPSDRGVVDKILRDRRRGKPVQIPPALQPAVDAVDRMMQRSRDLINAVRAVKGMAPIPQDVNYVPFARSGDYLTIATAPNGSKWVSAATTLREAEARAKSVEAQIRQQFPGSTPSVMVKTTSSKKGDLPALDFGTMAMLEKAGLLSTADYEKAIEQFDLPPGFGAHFKHAQKILGESKDLLDPINRYIDGVTNYTARFLHDDHMKELIGTIKDPAVRQYSEHYREYLNTKPEGNT